jgi:PIN domain nuclease of toxin-antitoxin system
VTQWAESVLALSQTEYLPLTPEIAMAAEGLPMHADPADRFIVATARHHQCPLVTKDAQIRSSKLTSVVW